MNKQEALLCSLIASATYTNRCNDDNFQITAKFENAGTDTQGLFGVAYNNTFVVAFRGSEETGLADWITDLKFLQKSFPYSQPFDADIKVHYGFIDAYSSVRDAVREQINNASHNRIICVGHSLGAALATLCALDISYNMSDKTVFCYTFGSPKVGNDKFVAQYNKRVPNTFRFVNGKDLVPGLPVGSYRHVSKAVRLGQEDADDDFGLDDIWDNVMESVLDKVEDHLPPSYIKAIKNFLA